MGGLDDIEDDEDKYNGPFRVPADATQKEIDRIGAPYYLRLLKDVYNKEKSPLCAWHAIERCRKHNLPFPKLIVEYLGECAINIGDLVRKSAASGSPNALREAEAVGKALGFGRGKQGRGNVFSKQVKDVRDFHIFYEVLKSVGVTPLGTACEGVGRKWGMSAKAVEKAYRGTLRKQQRLGQE